MQVFGFELHKTTTRAEAKREKYTKGVKMQKPKAKAKVERPNDSCAKTVEPEWDMVEKEEIEEDYVVVT